MIKEAAFSEDRKHRYLLSRDWSEGTGPSSGIVCFILLNPSTADETEDDPTIRRCIGFARSWGYTAIDVVNLWSYRATRPSDLRRAGNRGMTRKDTDGYIYEATMGADLVVAAWGASWTTPRCGEVSRMLRENSREVHCLGLTKGGEPRHPLYLKKTIVPILWEGCTH